jgi:hypothetical protein
MRINSTGLGIGESSPLGKLHVKTGESSSSVHASANEVIVEGSANTGISILSGNSNEGAIYFGDDGNNDVGRIRYLHNTNQMDFTTNGGIRASINSSGQVGIGTTSPTSLLSLEANSPDIMFTDTSGGTDSKKWRVFGLDSDFRIGCRNDANSSGQTAYTIVRSGATIDSHRFSTSDSERLRITSTGLVGIGTSSPSTLLHLSSTAPQISLTETDQSNKQYRIGSFGGAYAVYDVSASQYRHIIDTNGNHIFNEGSQDCDFRVESNNISDMFVVNGADDRVYINSGANVSSEYLLIRNNYTRTGMTIKSDTANPHHAIEFHNTNNQVGSINTNGSSTDYNTSSDYRLKENVNYNFDATSRLKQLKPARFNFIADADKTVDGFLAHEVSDIVPEAIHGTKDAVNEDGSIKPQGIDQSKLVPLLVKTIQELEARITTLEANNL